VDKEEESIQQAAVSDLSDIPSVARNPYGNKEHRPVTIIRCRGIA
jgi:hypothetical protein